MKTTKLERLSACKEAVLFSAKFKTPKEAWENCPRGDWMLWIASRLNVDKRLLTLAKGRCAETVLHLMRDQRSKDAVRAAIDFWEGRIDDEQLKIADAYVAAAEAADAYVAAAYAAAAAYVAAAEAADAYVAAAAVADAYAADAYVAAAYAAAAEAADAYVAAAEAADAYVAAAYAAAAEAADAYVADDARKQNQLATANICREILTDVVLSAYKKF